MQRINEQKVYSNYKRNSKFLGIIDYKSLAIIVIYVLIVVSILRVLPFSTEILIYSFMFLVVPVVAIFCINVNNENTFDVILIIINYILNRKIFVKSEYIKDFEPCIYKVYIENVKDKNFKKHQKDKIIKNI